MPASPAISSARAALVREGTVWRVSVAGDWRMTQRRPGWPELAKTAEMGSEAVRVVPEGLGVWDTSLILFIGAVQEQCKARNVPCDLDSLPAAIRELLRQWGPAHAGVRADRRESFVVAVGVATDSFWRSFKAILHFIGECVIGALRVVRRPRKFRWHDLLEQMQQCGAMALPIASLIAFLIGLTFAYQAAVTLREFGADIWVADLVGVLMVREMGPMMVAIILAGRTGAAFAATLGNMKTNEEIDALDVLGIPPVDFLVLPRLLALAVMMPLLVLYANGVGILGGMLVARSILQIPPTAYWIETQSIVDMTDITSGIVKAAVFGILIGLSGCLRGLQADRSAAGVGQAATSAVVTAIVLIIMADACFAVLFHLFGI